MSESSYLDFVADIFTTYDKTMLPVVHLADGIETKDGLTFGTGTIDLPAIIKIMHGTEYDGTVVLEVDQSDQPDALDYVHTVLDSL
jgi:sugar phosphate isomerase/epimerase